MFGKKQQRRGMNTGVKIGLTIAGALGTAVSSYIAGDRKLGNKAIERVKGFRKNKAAVSSEE